MLLTFSAAKNVSVTEKFHEARSFAHLTSKLLVTEVRRRASNQSTEEAAEAIASYMEIDSGGADATEDKSNNGWLLLSALNRSDHLLNLFLFLFL